MHPADIQAALKRKKITQKAIANEEGVSEMAISVVVNKKSVSDRLMKAIAKRLQKPVTHIFREYYNSNSKRPRKAA